MPASRRNVLKTLGALPFINTAMTGCGWDQEPRDSGMTTSTDTATTTSSGWAVGGTDLITGAYPDTSIFEQSNECTVQLTDSMTAGPCYFQDSTGEDISEGMTGLPMMLCLQLIDSTCQPLQDYTVEVWHCDANGVYSGDTTASAQSSNFSPNFCTGGDTTALQSSWYRGQLVTDVDGRVNFKTCFPGWYPGRTIHIHFAVSDTSGQSRVISQFTFEDALATDVYTNHPSYRRRGDQSTPLASGQDGIFPASGYEPYLMTTVQNSDGTLLAHHRIQIV